MNDKKKVRIDFVDFWGGFCKQNNFLAQALAKDYDIVIDESRPELVFFSLFGTRHLEYDCVKVFFTGENQHPDFNLCDYSIGFDDMWFGDRHFRLPLFATDFDAVERLLNKEPCVDLDPAHRKFCNFVYSNASADPIRDMFFHVLNGRRPVDSFGAHLRNASIAIPSRSASDWRKGKIDKQAEYNFTIAFENSSVPGYTTEKIMDAFVASTIPIYWGDPGVEAFFNKDAFINASRFSSLENCADYVMSVANNPGLIREYLSAPPFSSENKKMIEKFSKDSLARFLSSIIEQEPAKMFRRSRYGRSAAYAAKLKRRASTKRDADVSARLRRWLARFGSGV